MKDEIIRLLGLQRDRILQDAKIPKAKFYDLEDFNAQKKKIFGNDVDEISLLAILNEETINIDPLKNEEVNYSEVYVVFVSLKNDNNSSKIIEAIQKNIPNPTIIILSFKNKILIATARKRLSQVEKNRQVIESEQSTPWLTIDEQAQPIRSYLDGLNITSFSFQNLYYFYQEFSLYIYQSVLLPFRSDFKFAKALSIEELEPTLAGYLAKQTELRNLAEEESKTLIFGDKIAIHQRLVDAQRALGDIEKTINNLLSIK
jgi:hypothetical protein